MCKDYSNAKIYKLCSDKTNKIYIGSTTSSIKYRFLKHKQDYILYMNNFHKKIYSFDLFDAAGGFENCRVELIHDFPCKSRQELDSEEGRLQLLHLDIIVNRNIAGRTSKQYYQHNKQIILDKKREYYKIKNEYIKTRQLAYYHRTKEASLCS